MMCFPEQVSLEGQPVDESKANSAAGLLSLDDGFLALKLQFHDALRHVSVTINI